MSIVESRQMCIREFNAKLKELWEPYGGCIFPPLDLREQCDKISQPTGLVFFYRPVEGPGQVQPNFAMLNECAQDAIACGLRYTSAKLEVTTVVFKSNGEPMIDYDLNQVTPFESRPCDVIYSQSEVEARKNVNEVRVQLSYIFDEMGRSIPETDEEANRVSGWRDRIEAAMNLLGGIVCDCQNPPPYPDAEGCFGVSESCPIHGPIPGFTPFTGVPSVPPEFSEQVKLNSEAASKFRAEYAEQHSACPNCGRKCEGKTYMGYVVNVADGQVTNADTYQDQNQTDCVCGWKGIVHELVPYRKPDG